MAYVSTTGDDRPIGFDLHELPSVVETIGGGALSVRARADGRIEADRPASTATGRKNEIDGYDPLTGRAVVGTSTVEGA